MKDKLTCVTINKLVLHFWTLNCVTLTVVQRLDYESIILVVAVTRQQYKVIRCYRNV